MLDPSRFSLLVERMSNQVVVLFLKQVVFDMCSTVILYQVVFLKSSKRPSLCRLFGLLDPR